MPLTSKGKEILSSMEKTYKSPEKAKEVFYASANKGTITGVHNDRKDCNMSNDQTQPDPASGPMSTKGPSGGKVNNLPEAATPSSQPARDSGRAMSLDQIKAEGKRIGRY